MPCSLFSSGPATGRARRWRLAFAVSLFVCAPLVGAEPLHPLAAAVRDAWSAHPAASATEQTLAAARARAEAAARPLYNPEIELSVDDEGPDRTTTAGLAWTLDWSGKRAARRDFGSAEFDVASAEAQARRSAYVRSWLQAWADQLAAQRRVELGAQRVALVQRFADLADKQLAVGDISTLERDLALLARDETRAEQATLIADAAAASETLLALGGGSSLPALSADDALPPALAPADRRLDGVPEQQLALAQTRRAARSIQVAERDRRPDPTVSLRGGQVDLDGVSDNVVGLSVSIPLFVRNSFRAEVVAARSDADAATAEERRVSLEIEAAADRASATYAAMREAWQAWTTSAGTDVDARAALLERLWRAGELSTADYLIQLQQTVDTALAGADLQGRVWRTFVDALYANGQLDAWVGFDATNSKVTP